MLSNIEADVTLIPQLFSLSNIEKVPQLYSFWQWGALFLAIFATFTSLIRKRINLKFIYLRRIIPSTEPITCEDFDFSDDECSSISSNDEELISPTGDRDFSVAGQKSNLTLRRRRSSYELFPLTEFVAGKSVVKLWESNLFTVPSPAMVFSSKNFVFLAAYDTRMRSQSPAICAEWGTGKVVGIGGGGGERVYVRDEVAGVIKVGDMRKTKTPVEMWWDAGGGAVIVDGEIH